MKPPNQCLLLPVILVLCLIAPSVALAQSNDSKPILFVDPGGHTAVVRKVLFTPQGQLLISVGDDKVIRIWDTSTGEQLGHIHGQVGDGRDGKLYAAALSHDGKTLAVAGETPADDAGGASSGRRYAIRLISVDKDKLRAKPLEAEMKKLLPENAGGEAHTKAILTLAFSRDDKQLASAGVDHTVRVWDIASGRGKVVGVHKAVVDGVDFSLDGTKVVSASEDNTVCIWNADGGNKSTVLPGSQDETMRCVAWSPDGKYIAAGTGGNASNDYHGEIRLWNAETGKGMPALPRQDRPVTCLAFSSDSQSLASGQDGGTGGTPLADIWSIDGKKIKEFTEHDAPVHSIAFSPNDDLVASAGGGANDIYLWSRESGAVKQHLVGTGGTTSDVAWSSDGNRISWSNVNHKNTSTDGLLSYTFDMTSGLIEAGRVQGPNHSTWYYAQKSIDGKSLAISDKNRAVVIIKDGDKEVSVPPDPAVNDFVYSDSQGNMSAAITPDGKGVVVGSAFHLRLYTMQGNLVCNFVAHTGDIRSVAVSMDGRYLASTSQDQTVVIWKMPDLDNGGGKVQPLVSMFAGANGEWLAWTGYGCYACSPQGEHIIGWQVDNGPDKFADYTPASGYSDYNRLDVIKLLRDAGSVEAAVGRLKLALKPIDQSVPSVNIVSPTEGAAIPSDEVTVKLRISPRGRSRITGYTISLGGRPHSYPAPSGAADVSGDGSLIVEQKVPLKRGQPNAISALAGNGAGDSAPAKCTVTCSLPKVDVQPALSILAIGISQYYFFPPLVYPDSDAESIAKLFKEQEGPAKMFSKVDATVLTNENATKQAIVDALDALKNKPHNDNDYTIVFIAGHGGQTDDRSYFLLPYDVDSDSAEQVKNTAISWDVVNGDLNKTQGNVILMLDACHSAGAADNHDEAYGYIQTRLARDSDNGTSPLITYASCRPGELSQEWAVWRHGAFTKAILEALDPQNNPADRGHKGYVTAEELADFLKTEIPVLISHLPNHQPQTPRILGFNSNRDTDLPLVKVPKTAKTAETAQ